MAGFLAILGAASSGEEGRERLDRAAAQFRYADEDEVVVAETGCGFVWCGFDDPTLFSPAHDPETGVHVATAGRVSWDEPEWRRAEGLTSYAGGLSNRLLLDAYLRGGAPALERHNGPALLFVWDPRDRTAHLFTDHLGYHPVFLYRPDDPERCVIGTHADVMAADPAVDASADLVTMGEFLRLWRATPPHTYYREIKYAGPATHQRWDLCSGDVQRRTYWQPYEEEPYPSLETATEDLAHALSEAIRIRTLPRLGPTVCYISGGMDSRTILFAAAEPEQMVGLNMYDVPNRESGISRQLCAAAGVRYVGFARDPDYYPRWIAESARLSGAMWSTEDSHFLGTWETVRALGARTVMTGCTADRVFKASPMETQYQQLFGKNLPLKELYPYRIDAYLPNPPSGNPAPEILRAIEERFAERFGDTPRELKEDRDWLCVEDRRMRPNCYASSVSGPIMYRIFPYDTFLADRAVVDCYGRMRAEWKLNALVWGKAVARVSGVHKGITIANNGFQLDDSVPMKLWHFVQGWGRRRLRKHDTVVGQGPATDGSWPILGWYVTHSPTLRALWASATAAERARITALWGSDPWQHPLSYWCRRPGTMFRMLTLISHWRSRDGGAGVLAPAVGSSIHTG